MDDISSTHNLGLKSTKYSPDIGDYRGIHKKEGGRVFITASGPSLLETDPEILKNEWVFCVNETFNRFPWAQYAAACDREPALNLAWKEPAIWFVTRRFPGKYDKYKKTVFIRTGPPEHFFGDLTKGIHVNGTTTLFALQIADWMGFKKIYLLGLDLKEGKDRTHFYGNKPDFERLTKKHFGLMTNGFTKAAKKIGHKVVNCSMDSALSCFEKKPLMEVLDGS